MNTRLMKMVCKIAYVTGISVAVYNAVRISQMYKAVREYGLQLIITASDSAPYSLAIQRTPESVDAQIFAIFIGITLIMFADYLWKRMTAMEKSRTIGGSRN